MMNIILLGPPGAGKTTNVHFLSSVLNLPVIHTSKLLQINISAHSETELAPDDFVNAIVLQEISKHQYKNGFILDGYPRTSGQATRFSVDFCDQCFVFFLLSSKAVLTRRITSRKVCPNCGRVYVDCDTPPKVYGQCDDCQVALIKRSDDNKSLVKVRIEKEMNRLKQVEAILTDHFYVHTIYNDDNLLKTSHMIIDILHRNDPANAHTNA